MGGVGGVSQQDYLAVAPVGAGNPREIQPGRAAQVSGIAHQGVAAQPVGEQVFGRAAGLVLVHGVKAEAPPGRLRTFYDEGRGTRLELVGVGPDPAVRGLDKGEGEGVEGLFRAQPYVFVGPDIDVDAENLGVLVADATVEAVGGDDDISGQGADVGDLVLEPQLDPERPGAILKDRQQPLPADARETMAARTYRPAMDVDVDVVPMDEGRLDDGGGFRIIGLEICEGLVGEDHAPAEGVVRPVALMDHDVQ